MARLGYRGFWLEFPGDFRLLRWCFDTGGRATITLLRSAKKSGKYWLLGTGSFRYGRLWCPTASFLFIANIGLALIFFLRWSDGCAGDFG